MKEKCNFTVTLHNIAEAWIVTVLFVLIFLWARGCKTGDWIAAKEPPQGQEAKP
jgi:hypothetical protein